MYLLSFPLSQQLFYNFRLTVHIHWSPITIGTVINVAEIHRSHYTLLPFTDNNYMYSVAYVQWEKDVKPVNS